MCNKEIMEFIFESIVMAFSCFKNAGLKISLVLLIEMENIVCLLESFDLLILVLIHLFVCFITECFSSPSYLRIFFIIFIVTFLIGLLKVLIIRQVILQWNSNKIKSSADYRVSASKKVSGF